MRLRNLWALQAVMEAGSITEAAKRIHRTQPQVSRLISSLEDELGFLLFLRHGRGLIPTQECLRFYESTRHILSGFDEVSRVAEAIRNHDGMWLRIVTQPYIAHSVISSAIAQFSRLYPDVRVSLEVRSRVDVGSWVSGQRFDLGLAALPIEFPGIRSKTFAKVRLVVVLPVGHPLSSKRTLAAEDISGQPFIALRPLTLLRKYIDDLVTQKKVDIEFCAETSSGLSACQLAREGLGITLADPVLASSVEGVVLREFRPSLYMPYGFLLPSAYAPSELAQQFAKILVTAVKKRSPRQVELAEDAFEIIKTI